ncbi:HNH endonuclease [Serratia phage SALSA]|uniref:HNH endonuclease n=1 Tax=Serratia phage SALSA TaxID=2736256 RepID=A0A7G9UTN6_9CAUD|nr:HNH endonuclease [Serratia phage SALSA]
MITLEERLEAGSRVNEATGCIEWQGAKHHSGYGVITIKRKAKRAHRVAYEVAYGEIPKGKLLCHTCDNKLCINPAHLIPGTHKENMQDMVASGKSLKGTKHHKAVLNEDLVREIRYATGTHQEIADRFGVSKSNVGFIRRRETWTHVN